MINKLLKFVARNTDRTIFIMALSLSVVSFIYYYDQGLITAYGDATTHLNVARRTIDNITPGMAQLGGIWLPLLHVLMLPTIWNDFFWFSGISGSIVSMPAFILSVLIIYKLIYFLTKDKYKAVLGSALMALNINFLYLQTTPMTEALFVTTLISGVYLLTKWANDQRIFYILYLSKYLKNNNYKLKDLIIKFEECIEGYDPLDQPIADSRKLIQKSFKEFIDQKFNIKI